MRSRDIDTALIVHEIIDAIGYGYSYRILAKIVGIDPFRLLSPDATTVEKEANQFLVLGINTDDRASCVKKELLDAFDVAELAVSIGMWRARQAFTIGDQAKLVLLQ